MKIPPFRATLTAAVLVLATSWTLAQEPECKHIANYKMDVRLDAVNKTVTGVETLTWTNDSGTRVSDLYFHLYLNAFKNFNSTFVKEALRDFGSMLAHLPIKEEYFGYIDIDSVAVLPNRFFKAADLTRSVEFVQPDDGNNDDQTVMKVTLPRPIPPRGSIKLLIAFESKLPRAFARTGYKGNYFFVAQWFPKIGVFENGKWNCHQFHPLTEFFADYGIYDVNITVPADFIVGATGVRRNKIENEDGTVTYNYYQESVHDFAWTASPHYVEIEDKFFSPPLREVNLTLLIQPQHLHMVERYFEATKHTLKYYGQWYGEYPYPHLTIVDPAFNSRTGGMEYPTLFTGGTDWLSPKAILSPESVTIHECGHQFWYGLVANNEFENAWMDEGFNSYAQAKVIQKVYGIRPYERRYFGFPVVFDEVKINPVTRRMPAYLEAVKSDETARKSYTYVDRASLRANAYSKPALMLSTLENYLGEETFGKIMKTYSLRWRYKHPKPQDFIDVVHEITGKDMSWFFDGFLYSSNVLDYAVGRISSRPKMKMRGFFDKDGERVFFSGKEKGEKEKEITYKTEVLIQRLGEARMPVEILITFANGDTVRKEWDGQYRWVKYTFEKPTQLKSVQVDPDHKLVLDINYTNNSRVLRPKKTAALRWASKWMFWLQHLLEIFSFFS